MTLGFDFMLLKNGFWHPGKNARECKRSEAAKQLRSSSGKSRQFVCTSPEAQAARARPYRPMRVASSTSMVMVWKRFCM